MKKIISYFLSGIVLCTALLVTHVSAAEVAPAEETITINSTVSVRATNYWTKTTTKLNSVYGTIADIDQIDQHFNPFAAPHHIAAKRPECFLLIVACLNIPAK